MEQMKGMPSLEFRIAGETPAELLACFHVTRKRALTAWSFTARIMKLLQVGRLRGLMISEAVVSDVIEKGM